MKVPIAPSISKAGILNALASKTNYTMLDNPAFLERGDQTYNTIKNVGMAALDILHNISGTALSTYGNGSKTEGIRKLTDLLREKLGSNYTNNMESNLGMTVDNAERLRNTRLDDYKQQVNSFNSKFGEGIRNFLKRVGVNGADNILLQDIILNKWDMNKTPLENLKDIDELKDYVFRNIDNKSLLDDLEIDSNMIQKMFRDPKGASEKTNSTLYDIAKSFGRKTMNTAVDVGSMALDSINQLFRKGYSFVRDEYHLKNKLDQLIEDYMNRPDVKVHFREAKDYHEAMARQFALTYLGDPTLNIAKLPEDNPYRMIFEAHKGNKGAIEKLNKIGMNPDKVKARLKAINEYAVLNELPAENRDSLLRTHIFQTDENFYTDIVKPLNEEKDREKIDKTIDFTGNVVNALSLLKPHLKALKYNTEKDFTDHMKKQEETYEQSLTNLAEDIIKEVDNKAIPVMNGTGWLTKKPENSEKDRSRNLTVNRLASSLLDIGLYTKDNLMDWFRTHKNDYQPKGSTHFLSINSNLPEAERAKLTDNMIRDYKHYVTQEDIPLISHQYNDMTNNPLLSQPQGRITPATLAYLRHEYRQSRPGFKRAKESYEKQKKFNKGTEQYNYLEKEAVENTANAMLETDYFSEMLNRYENLPHAVMAFSKEELSEFTPQKLKELNEATIGMNPDQIADYLYRDVKSRRAESYDKMTGSYKPFDFSGAKEFRNQYFHENKGNIDDGNPRSYLFATPVTDTNYNITAKKKYTQDAETRMLHSMTERKFREISNDEAKKYQDFVRSHVEASIHTKRAPTPRPTPRPGQNVVRKIRETPRKELPPEKNPLDDMYRNNEKLVSIISAEPDTPVSVIRNKKSPAIFYKASYTDDEEYSDS